MLNRGTTALMGVELLALALWFPHIAWTPMKAAGGVITVVSMMLVIVARMHLGSSFSVRAKATRLVTTGMYSRVRNPIYVSGVLLFCGIALLLESWWPLLILVVLVPMQRMRARREAEVLRERFGEEYERYRRGTWF